MASKLAMKDIDFLPILQRKAMRTRVPGRAKLALVLLALFAVALAAGFALYTREAQGIDFRRQSVEAFLGSPEVAAGEEEARQIESDALSAERRAATLKTGLKALDEEPRLTSADISSISRLTGPTMMVTELHYDNAFRTLNIRLIGSRADELAGFVARLRGYALIEDILYTGYAASGEMAYTLIVNPDTGETEPAPAVEPPLEDEDAPAPSPAPEEEPDEEEEANMPDGTAYIFEVTARIKGGEEDV